MQKCEGQVAVRLGQGLRVHVALEGAHDGMLLRRGQVEGEEGGASDECAALAWPVGDEGGV